MGKTLKSIAICMGLAMLSSSAIACDDCGTHKEDRKFYLGLEGGVSSALKKEFTHKETKMKGALKSSPLYGALVGYRFYPGMAIEASWQHKPKYTLNFKLPEFPAAGITTRTPGKTKIVSDIYMIGLVYDLQQLGSFTPYIGIDGGIARIKSKYVSVARDIPTPIGLVNMPIFRIKNAHTISPAMQITLGISTAEILPNLRVNLSGRVQIIKDAKIKYESLNLKTGQWDSARLKQTLGVGEIVLGISYDLF